MSFSGGSTVSEAMVEVILRIEGEMCVRCEKKASICDYVERLPLYDGNNESEAIPCDLSER
jgi:hypothetical protein